MIQTANISQPVRNVFSENSNVFMIRTKFLSRLVVCPVNLNNRLGSVVTIIIGLQLLLLMQFGIVGNDVLLSQGPVLVLINLIVVIPTNKLPVKTRNRTTTTSPHQ